MAREVDLKIEAHPKPLLLPPKDGEILCTYLSLPHKDIPALVAEYVNAMETQETNKWCRCEWIIHPDDVEIPDNHCRDCNAHHDDVTHQEGQGHIFRGKRMRRGDQADDCPVHTKEGFLLYFFEWVFTHEGD